MKKKEIETTNLDEVLKGAKMPRFVYDEVHLNGTSNLKKKEEPKQK